MRQSKTSIESDGETSPFLTPCKQINPDQKFSLPQMNLFKTQRKLTQKNKISKFSDSPFTSRKKAPNPEASEPSDFSDAHTVQSTPLKNELNGSDCDMHEQPDSYLTQTPDVDSQYGDLVFENFQIEGDRYIPRRLFLDNSDTMFDKKSFIMEQEYLTPTKLIQENQQARS